MEFPTTHWSEIVQASLNGSIRNRTALENLCGRYWIPIYRFIRSRRIDTPEAQDLTQDFMLHLLQKGLFSRADAQRGRFRSFLLGSLLRFLADAADKRRASKRGGGRLHVSLDSLAEWDTEKGCEPEAALVFDREWAIQLLELSLDHVRNEYVLQNREDRFAALSRFLPGSAKAPSYEEAARDLEVSPGALKTEVHRLRRRFRSVLYQEVAKTVSAPHEIDSEFAHLQQVLMSNKA